MRAGVAPAFRAAGSFSLMASLMASTVIFAAPAYAVGDLCEGTTCTVSAAISGAAGAHAGDGGNGGVGEIGGTGLTGASGGTGTDGAAGGNADGAADGTDGVDGNNGNDADPATALGVTSREVVWLFFEQLRSEFVPVFHRLQGSP